MKRKFKLITSVASLCIAIALMAFGVYAASNPTVTVTGSVTFNADNVYATVNAVGAKATGADAWTGTSLGSEVKFEAGSATDAANFAIVTEEGDGHAANTAYLDDVNKFYQYQVTIKSDYATGSAAEIEVEVTKLPTMTGDGVTFTATYKVGDGDAANLTTGKLTTKIAAGETMTITVNVAIDPAVAAGSIAATDIGLGLKLDRV